MVLSIKRRVVNILKILEFLTVKSVSQYELFGISHFHQRSIIKSLSKLFSSWLISLIQDNKAEEVIYVISLVLSSFCLSCFIIIELVKVILLYEFYLENISGNLMWLAIMSLSTFYIVMVSILILTINFYK